MKLVWSRNAWEDYVHWQSADRETLERINLLIRECMRTPFAGIGKPEPLKGDLKGYWSRRISREHRLVYRVAGKDKEQALQIAACHYHYLLETEKLMTDAPNDIERHNAKMAKKKAARDKIMATKTDEKGLIIVHTGKGKGKSTAAFGMIFRHIAHGRKCAVVQFIKGGMSTGERDLILDRFSDLCDFHTMGEGFTWETQDKARDMEMAQAAWEKAKELIRDEANQMVLLDEINIAIRYDYIDINDVVAFLRDEKPPMTHVVLTGRNAKDELIDIADLVTEMELIKHPFRSGVKAQIGVEW